MEDFRELENLVIKWADDKGILSKATRLAQANKTLEEVQELIEACTAQANGEEMFVNSKNQIKGTAEECKDSLGDILVTIIIQAKMQGLDLLDCLSSAYDIISKRSGKMVNGQFKKDE